MTEPYPQGDERTSVIIRKTQTARIKQLWPDASVSAVARRALDQFLDRAEEAAKKVGSACS